WVPVLVPGLFAVPEFSRTTTTTATPNTTRAASSSGPSGPLPGTVTCATAEQAGSASALPAASLRAIQPQQALSCIAFLGKDPLGEDQARAVWDLLLQAYETADMVPDETLRLLGWVAAGIPPDHIANLSLSEFDTVAALGVFHNLSLDQLSAMADSVRFQWSAKEPEDLSYLDLTALNHILCGFNASDVARIHADAYKEAASSLSLLRCPGTPGAAPVPGVGGSSGADLANPNPTLNALPSLRVLASMAESGDAFGDPASWSAATVRAIGCVLVGLPSASLVRIPVHSMHAMLQALAGADQLIVRKCMYGTPVIAQRLSSAELPLQSASTSTAVPTLMGASPSNSTTSSNSSVPPGAPGMPHPAGLADQAVRNGTQQGSRPAVPGSGVSVFDQYSRFSLLAATVVTANIWVSLE
ncbi:uncharacterized protein LOC127750173, partial [Frankliniella occidentalis]|uniref:Uncharacterized protein LOC127750173 n=1 Tax=Frankliniella occidentalis TaxID=133901 RepID=A0A9C6UEY5_FRAOC